MSIEFPCQNPQCGKKMKAPDGTSGRKARCPLCKTVQVIPEPAPPPPTSLHPELETGDDSLLGFSDEELADRSEDQTDPDQCQDCHAFMGGSMICPNCGWIRPDALGDPLPAQKNALADQARQQAEAQPGVQSPRAKPESLASGCVRAIFYGVSNFRSLLKLVVYSIGLRIGLMLVAGVLMFMACLGPIGLFAYAAVILGSLLVIGGYFLRFYLDCCLSSLEGVNVAPDVPEFDLKELFFVGLKAVGVAVVYVVPVVTIPLLPLALLAWAHSADYRAFDLRWSFRAAIKKPGPLLLTWAFLLLWGVVGYVAVWVGELLTALLVAAVTSMFDPGFTQWLVTLVVQIFPTMVVAALFHMFNSMIFRCIGMLGRYHSDLLELAPENTSPGAAAGFIAGGVGVGLVEFVVVLMLGPMAALSSLGPGFGPEEQLDAGPAQPQQDDDEEAKRKAALAARREAQRKQRGAQRQRQAEKKQPAPARKPAKSALAKVPDSQPAAQTDLSPLGYLQTVVRSKDLAKLSKSVQNLRNVGHEIKKYQLERGRFPESLDELVEAGALPEKLLASPGSEDRRLVYLKPDLALPRGETILVFDPVAYMSDRIPVVRVNGQAQHINREDLLQQLRAQGVQ